MSRTENSIRNLRYGVLHQIVDTFLKFIMRSVMVYTLGNQIVGLNGLFTEVLAMLSLAELGVGSAITYSLYKPLAEKNTQKVASLMILFKRAYLLIGLSIFLIGMALLPFVHTLVTKTDFDLSYIRLVFFIFLLSTCASYLFSYKTSLLNADQKAYVTTRIYICIEAVSVSVKTVILLLTGNFVLFLILEIFTRLLINLFVSREASKLYPFLKEKATLPSKDERKEIFKNIRYLFIGKLSGNITNSTDNTLISVMDSTVTVGLYSNYAMVLNSGRTCINQMIKATSGSIGNLMATGDVKTCMYTLQKITFIMFLPASVATALIVSQLSPFVALWLGESRVLLFSVVVMLAINFLFSALKEPLWNFVSVAGVFQKDKNISIMGSVANLIISVIFGLRYGMFGIFLGTFFSMLIQYVFKTRLLFKAKFGLSTKQFHFKTLSYFLATTLSTVLSYFIPRSLGIQNPIVDFLVGCIFCVLITCCVNLLLFYKTREMQYVFELLKKTFQKVAKKLSGKRGKKHA